MDIRDELNHHVLVADGAMGTYYEIKTGKTGGIAEQGNFTHPEEIIRIHQDYIESGARILRTNTFAMNSMFFKPEIVKLGIEKAWQLAKTAVRRLSRQDIYIAADMGPIEESEQRDADAVSTEYCQIAGYFAAAGARVFAFETLSEYRFILAAVKQIKREVPDAFIIVQFSLNRHGYTRAGISMNALLAECSENAYIDAVGFNCGVGPAHLYELLKKQPLPANKFITSMPNAGYPTELRGRTMYSDNAEYYVTMTCKLAELGMDIIGGCCGTTPVHIQGICDELTGKERPLRKLQLTVTDKVQEEKHSTPFMNKLMNHEKVYTVELDPPFNQDDERFMKCVRLLESSKSADMVTIADSPLARARADSLAVATKVHYTTDIAAMPHICCRDKNIIAQRAQFLGMHMNGMRHALIVTGDPVAEDSRSTVKSVFNFNSIKLMHYVKTMNDELFGTDPIYYGGALNYNHGSLDNIIRRIQEKLDAGASYFLTQPVYSEEDIERICYIKSHTDCCLLAGIMPLVSRKNALFMKNEMPGIHVPDEIVERYKPDMSRAEYEQVAEEISLGIMKRLMPYCDGFYMMTPFNRVELIERIIKQARAGE